MPEKGLGKGLRGAKTPDSEAEYGLRPNLAWWVRGRHIVSPQPSGDLEGEMRKGSFSLLLMASTPPCTPIPKGGFGADLL